MKKLIVIFSLGFIASCATGDNAKYTLYRTGIDIPTQKHDELLRIHVSTFDASPLHTVEDNAKYNLANCEIAQQIFNASQPHTQGSVHSTINIKYWCEKGQYKK